MALRPVAFYAVADARHFLGLVALLNSLRLAGHEEPLLVGDSGLDRWQRELLFGHAEVVTVETAPSPHFAKWALPRERPAAVMAHLDADLIVLRLLTPLLDSAAAGRVVAFADPVAHRFDPRWETILGVPALRRQPYVNSGVIAFPHHLGARLLDALVAGQSRIEYDRSRPGGGTHDYPFYYLDQDVVNAVLASLFAPEELEILDSSLAPHPPFTAVRLGEGATIPYVLHHIDRKPWLEATRANLYSKLLPRFLLAEDLTVRLDPGAVPLRFRPAPLAALERLRVEAAALLREQRGKLGLRRWLAERVRPRSAGA